MPNQFTSTFGGAGGAGSASGANARMAPGTALPNQDPYKIPNMAQKTGLRAPRAMGGTSAMASLGQTPGPTATGAPPPVPGQTTPQAAGLPPGVAQTGAPLPGAQPAAPAMGPRTAHAVVNPYGGSNLPGFSPAEAAAGLGPGSSPAAVASFEVSQGSAIPQAASTALGTNLVDQLNGAPSPALTGFIGQAGQQAGAKIQQNEQQAAASGFGANSGVANGLNAQTNGQLAAAIDAQRANLYNNAQEQAGTYLQTGNAPSLQGANLQNTQAETANQTNQVNNQLLTSILGAIPAIGGGLGVLNSANPLTGSLAQALSGVLNPTAAAPSTGTGSISIGQPNGGAGLFGTSPLMANARPAGLGNAGSGISKPWWQ